MFEEAASLLVFYGFVLEQRSRKLIGSGLEALAFQLGAADEVWGVGVVIRRDVAFFAHGDVLL